MALTFNGINQSQIAITGGVSTVPYGLSAGQTLICKNANAVANDTTVHTVTAGKTFYCLGCVLANGGATALQNIKVAGTVVVSSVVQASNSSPCLTGGIIFSATSTQAITVTGAGAVANYCTLWGYEI